MNFKKILAMVLSVAMILGTMGTVSFAAEEVVVKVGTNEYATFEEAVANAKSGDTIKLLSDVTLAEEVELPADITLDGNGNQINGTIYAGGNLTINGHTKVTAFSAGYYDRVITIAEGACLEVTGTGRVTLGYGNTFNITGTITDAKAADKESVTPSLVIPAGISITGGTGATMNVTNAYIKLGGTSSKNSVANGKFALNFNNSIADFTDHLTIAEPTSGKTPEFFLNLKDSVLTVAKKLCIAAADTATVIDNSTVTLGTYFRNSGLFELKNDSVFTGGTIQFGENGGNNGEIVVDKSYLEINASSKAHALDGRNTGIIVLRNNAIADIDYIINTKYSVDSTSNLIATTDDTCAEATYADPVVKVDGVRYATLKDAFKAVKENSVITLLTDITVDENWDRRKTNTGMHSTFTVPVTLDGANHTIKFVNVIKDANQNDAFRFEAPANVKNLTFDLNEATAATWMRAISAKNSIAVDNCTFLGNPNISNTRAIIVGEGAGDAYGNVTARISNCTFKDWRYGVTDNENGKGDPSSMAITECSFENGGAKLSAKDEIIFTNNVMENAWVNIKSYTNSESLAVCVLDNILEENGTTTTTVNKIDVSGTITAQEGIFTPVAIVDGIKYLTLDSAIAAANGKTVKLLCDITLDDTVFVGSVARSAAASITLDLNGYTITSADNTPVFTIGDATLTITDSSDDNTGKIIANGDEIFDTPDTTQVKVEGGSYNKDVSEFAADGFVGSVDEKGNYTVVTDDSKDNNETSAVTETVSVRFEKKADNKYDIVLEADSSATEIHRFLSAELDIKVTADNNSTINLFSVEGNKDHGIEVIDPLYNESGVWGFHLNDEARDVSGNKIVIGTVTVTGYGSGDIAVEANVNNKVEAIESVNGNIVKKYCADLANFNIPASATDVNIKVPTQKLTIKISFPNAISESEKAYQDMHVVVTGKDIDGYTYDLGADGDVTLNADGCYVIEMVDKLTKDNSYNILVTGAGYRTAKYRVTMTEDKTVYFWNNAIKDGVKAYEEGGIVKTAANFLAGDIAEDNIIDKYDLAAVVSYFGKYELKSNADFFRFNKYDLNRDGKIDSEDIAYVLASFNY